jgi:N-sulfoglucosamine sulfohydrolase
MSAAKGTCAASLSDLRGFAVFREFLVVGVSVLLAWVNLAPAAEKPNLVVFICDDLGVLDLAPYGAKDVRTPNMERVATAGLKFTRAFVASPSCAPSRAALLTGLMPARNGAEPNHSRPREEIKKLPAYLQELGYEVASFGKVAHYGHAAYYRFDVIEGEGFQRYEAIGQAADFLNHRNSKKPLCLFVGTHWPHVPWPEGQGYEASAVRVPPTHVDTAETRVWRTRYYAAVTKGDDDLGTVLDAVRERLDPKNTFTFFTSDHGAQWPFGKWNLYDAGIRVPLIVAGPGIKAGATSEAMVSWVDILPTLVELAGGTPPKEIDGRSFAGVLRGEKAMHRDEIYTTHSGDRDFNVYPIRSVRDGRWKYILNLHPEYQHATHINRAAGGDGLAYFRSWEEAAKKDPVAAKIVQRYKERPQEELYDLADDPQEQNNVAGEPQNASRLAEMRAKVAAWMKEQGDAGTVFNEPLLLGQEATPIVPAGAKGNKKAAK